MVRLIHPLRETLPSLSLYEFESRFGSNHNLVDFDNDGVLDYFKISNGKRQSEYLLTVHCLTNNRQLERGLMLLRYELNDEFIILEDSLR